MAGANILRSNFAHTQYDEYMERRQWIQELNAKHGTNVWMQADLQGRNIRIQKFENDLAKGLGAVVIEKGNVYSFSTLGGTPEDGDIIINDDTLHLDVKAGEPIAFMDGAMEGTIEEVKGHRIFVRMHNSGSLISRKSINVPDTLLSGISFTEKDRRDTEFLIGAGVEWLVASFVAGPEEAHEIRKMIGDRPIKVMAKVERKEAIKHLPKIVEAYDSVMIARGDLGIEMPLEEIPVMQKMMIELCRHAGKPVVTATQMLLSMTDANRPTRAEVSDVANAVFDRSDAVMLSEETAAGHNPVQALQTMVRIAKRAEDYLGRDNYFFS
jgi:pyruvate kinase